MNAYLNATGKYPLDNERLNSSAMYGATRSATDFNSDVGMGSAAEALSGSWPITEMTSSAETVTKTSN